VSGPRTLKPKKLKKQKFLKARFYTSPGTILGRPHPVSYQRVDLQALGQPRAKVSVENQGALGDWRFAGLALGARYAD